MRRDAVRTGDGAKDFFEEDGRGSEDLLRSKLMCDRLETLETNAKQ